MTTPESRSPLDEERPPIESLDITFPAVLGIATVAASTYSAGTGLPFLQNAAVRLEGIDEPFVRREVEERGSLSAWLAKRTTAGLQPSDVAEFRALLSERTARMLAAHQGLRSKEIRHAGIIAYHQSKRPVR
jgi:hypothetical protein